MRRSAFTLTECILALFALTGVIVSVATLLWPVLHYQSLAEQQALAGLAAERLVEEMRAAASTPAGFGGLPATYDGTTHTYPELPGISLLAEVRPFATFNPSRSLESPLTNPKAVNGSLLLIGCTASWNGKALRVTSLVGEPPRLPVRVAVNLTGPSNVAAGGTTSLQAQLEDGSGNIIPDVTFRWSVRAQTGNASVAPGVRDGTAAVLTNSAVGPGGVALPAPGQCQVEARAIYYGVEVVGISVPITLL